MLSVVVIGLAGCGGSDGDVGSGATKRPRVVEVSMRDQRFAVADELSVAQGDVIVFRFWNRDDVLHEAVIGDELFQAGHADHEHAGAEQMVNAVVVEPGATVDLPYRFDVPGPIFIGCHEPGHWEDGMKLALTVNTA